MAITTVKNQWLLELYEASEKWLGALFLGLLFVLFCFLCYKGPILEPDSGGYIQNATIRSPLYPILLSAYTKIFGADNYGCLAILQILFGFWASFYTASTLTRLPQISVPKSISYLVTLVLLFPYWGPCSFGNIILTEALCYPLFLLMFSLLLQALLYKNTRFFIYSMIITGLLVLTRGQFLFIYPAIGILLGYIFLFERKSFKSFTLLFCFILTIVGANLAERTYQYLYHGQFKLVPYTGMQLIVAPLYLSSKTDGQYLKTEKERELFQDIWNVMEQKKINFNSLKTDSYFHMATYTLFYDSYNKICWESLAPLLSKYNLTSPYQIDPFFIQMGTTLIMHNLKGFFTLYLLNIVFNIGGVYFALLLCVATLSALAAFLKTRHPLALAYLLAALLTVGNYTLVALVEPILRRYSAYTDTLLISVLLIIVTTVFYSRNQPDRLELGK